MTLRERLEIFAVGTGSVILGVFGFILTIVMMVVMVGAMIGGPIYVIAWFIKQALALWP